VVVLSDSFYFGQVEILGYFSVTGILFIGHRMDHGIKSPAEVEELRCEHSNRNTQLKKDSQHCTTNRKFGISGCKEWSWDKEMNHDGHPFGRRGIPDTQQRCLRNNQHRVVGRSGIRCMERYYNRGSRGQSTRESRGKWTLFVAIVVAVGPCISVGLDYHTMSGVDKLQTDMMLESDTLLESDMLLESGKVLEWFPLQQELCTGVDISW